MSDATVGGLQCRPGGDGAGRKGRVGKGPPKRQPVGLHHGGRRGPGRGGGGCLQGLSNSSQACSQAAGEGGNKHLPLLASWPASLCSD